MSQEVPEPIEPDIVEAGPVAAVGSQAIAAEAIGTFILVLLGCGAALATGAAGGTAPDTVATGLSFGIAVVIGAYAFGRISGGHFNPAVTVGVAASGRFAWRNVPVYVGAQVVGAILAAAALWVVLQGFDGYTATDHMAQNGFGSHGSGLAWWAAFLAELVLTAVFVFIILAVTDARHEYEALAPLAIGLALAAIHFVAIPLTGTSVNPARSIGPALFAGGSHIVQLWLFILAPLLGGVIAGVLFPVVFGHGSDPVPGSGISLPSLPTPAAKPTDGTPAWSQADETTSETAMPTSAFVADTSGEHGVDPATGQPRIIQDGWEWDYVAQQWKPATDTPPSPPQA
ncbi:MIP/aquaporin family protein [Nocardioides sp.]|uniref:MIP/aquaporin family protein n=1 Tax=Nocardioides sp. TaxID=35761 RepID=UPI0039E61DA4